MAAIAARLALTFCTYNPLCAHGERLLDISKVIRADVVGLPGTMYRNYDRQVDLALLYLGKQI